ncbi:MAG TPA: hypothetical protein VL737_00060 [Candidatus Pristimantibacillus sp.]|jgi:hypothetical protein|nr:hypothetical protein [Candidatus Pristimantibacillus sp.]
MSHTKARSAVSAKQPPADRSPYALAFEAIAQRHSWTGRNARAMMSASRLLNCLQAADDPRLHGEPFEIYPYHGEAYIDVTEPFDTLLVGKRRVPHTLNWGVFNGVDPRTNPLIVAKVMITPPDGVIIQKPEGIYVAHHRESDAIIPFEIASTGRGPVVLPLGEIMAKNTLDLLLQADEVLAAQPLVTRMGVTIIV